MKDKRIVASFDKVSLPIDREDALLERILREADAERASLEKEQKVNTTHTNSSEKRSSRTPKKRWPLVLVACLLLAVTLIACIPEARAEVLAWFGKIFSAQDYLGEERGARSPEPAMDAIITKVNDDGREVTVRDIYDSDKARALANGFGVKLDEVAYIDGEVYIAGWFTGTSGKFLLDQWTGGDTWSEEGEWLEGRMMLTMPNGEIYLGVLNPYFTEEMDAIMRELAPQGEHAPGDAVFDESGKMITGNARADALWYRWLQDNDVRFTFEAHKSLKNAQPLSGRVEAMLSFVQYHYVPASDSSRTLFRADLGPVTIDADAYADNTHSHKAGQSVTLGGTHRIFVDEWQYQNEALPELDCVKYYVRDLDMSGVTITVESVTFAPTGPEIAIRLDLPESWTRAERIAAIRGHHMHGLRLLTLVDGEAVDDLFRFKASDENGAFTDESEPFLTYKRILHEPTIPPSRWDEIETLTLIPCTGWPAAVRVRDANGPDGNWDTFVLEPGVIVTLQGGYSMNDDDWLEDRMDEYAITIRLDDYR